MKAHTLPYHADCTPYFTALQGLSWPVWLDSQSAGRYDIIAAEPFLKFLMRDGRLSVIDPQSELVLETDPWQYLQDELAGYQVDSDDGVPFAGGAIGFFGYELLQAQLPPNDNVAIPDIPDMAIGLYDWAVVVDHARQHAALVTHNQYHGTRHVWQHLLKRFANRFIPSDDFSARLVEVNMDMTTYAERFNQIKAFLQAGDCYQVNLAKRWHFECSGNSLAAYLRLRRVTAARYGAFLDFDDFQILSCSPECFLTKQGSRVVTQPIKGTMPRGQTAAEDTANLNYLKASQKDQAENLMIVDLLRNDLSQQCKAGSVQVSKLFECVTYPTVHHMVSEVTGELQAGVDAVMLLKSCFPGGSITGAPKQRVREIIQALEPHRRHVYCGAIGYIGFDGRMDTNIAIRTLLRQGDALYAWAGGGIVSDSDVTLEWQESEAKLAKIVNILVGG